MTDRVRVDFVLVEVLAKNFRVAASDSDPMGPVGQQSSSGRNRA